MLRATVITFCLVLMCPECSSERLIVSLMGNSTVTKRSEEATERETEKEGERLKQASNSSFQQAETSDARFEQQQGLPGLRTPGFAEDMAKIANAVYDESPNDVNGWNLVMRFPFKNPYTMCGKELCWRGEGRDVMAVYRKQAYGVCVLAFTGSNNDPNWKRNYEVFGAAETTNPFDANNQSVSIHKGFLAQFNLYADTKEWRERVANYLNQPEKCSSVYTVGHSLGGAIATLFALRLNQAHTFGDSKSCAHQSTIRRAGYVCIEKLYTFGAPAISPEKSIALSVSEGARFFNMGVGSQCDPAPKVLMGKMGFHHPAIPAIELGVSENGQEIPATCKFYSLPIAKARPSEQCNILASASGELHGTQHYIDRLHSIAMHRDCIPADTRLHSMAV